VIGGYYGARFFKTLKGTSWVQYAVTLVTFFPGLVCGTGFVINFFVWGQGSSAAVPFTTMLALLCIWFGLSLPFVLGGAYFGYRKQVVHRFETVDKCIS
jgi:transmembrane 9 superfamily protein 2/4